MLRIPFGDRSIGLCSIISTVAAPAVGLSGAATAGISIGAIAAEELIRRMIGQGRKAADKWVKSGTGQNAFQKDVLAPAAIIARTDPQKASDLVGQAWSKYLESANSYATQGKNQAQVIKQNLSTPAFMQTVTSLLGRNPLGQEFTQPLGTPLPQMGNLASIIQTIAPIAASAAAQSGGEEGNDPQGGINQAPPSEEPTAASADTTIPAQPAQPAVNTNPDTVPGGAATQPTIAAPRRPGILSRIGGVLAGTGGAGGAGNPNASLLERLLPNLISGGAAVASGLIGSRAANQAATVQSDAALEAARLNAQAGRDAIAFNRDVLTQQQANQQPWIDAGTGALRRIGDIVNDPGYSFTETYKPPTPEEAMADPGIRYQLEQGQRALEAYQRASGTHLSGAAAKEINERAQGIASTGYGDVAARKLQTFNTNYNTFANERSARLNPQLAIAGLGQTSTAQLNTNLTTAANDNANINMTTAANVGNQQTSAAAARASGVVGGANAWNNTLSQVSNNLMDARTVQQILQAINNRG